ncbi:MAG: amidase [Psychrobium sp.]
MWRLLLPLWLTSVSLTANAQHSFDDEKFNDLTLTKAQQLLASKKLTSVELVKFYLHRIEQFDQKGPSVNSVPVINPKVLAIAKQLDNERANGASRGPLHGIPVVLKDNIDTGDGMANTAGSLALKSNYPTKDAHLVAKLREAGAIILGKANLSEWANFRGYKSSSGWSGLWGQTKNPHNVNYSTCGSSAGSGAAVAGDFALLAIGTETDGSITCPSALTGIVGIKPTLGTVSRHGIIPLAHSQDTAGPMAKTVTGAVTILDAMRNFDTKDPSAIKTTNSLIPHLKLDGLKGKRIGVVRNLMGYHKGLDAQFEIAINDLKKRGAIIVDNTDIAHLKAVGADEFTVLLFEFKHDLNLYLADTKTGLTLEKLIKFNKQHAEKELIYFGQEIFKQAQATSGITDKIYLEARQKAKKLMGAQGIDAVLQKHKLDLLIAPTTQPAWKIDWKNGDKSLGAASRPAAVSGYPHITVPMGFVDNLPVGLSFFGGFLSEPTLIEAAYDFEQATQYRRQPKLALN